MAPLTKMFATITVAPLIFPLPYFPYLPAFYGNDRCPASSGRRVEPIQPQKALCSMDYPLPKDKLGRHGQGKNTGDEVLFTLKDLPDKKYETSRRD